MEMHGCTLRDLTVGRDPELHILTVGIHLHKAFCRRSQLCLACLAWGGADGFWTQALGSGTC